MTKTRINTADDSRATMTGTTFAVATLNNYTFGIPSGATINGIEVNTEFSICNASATATLQISLSWDNGTNYTTAKSDTITGTTTDKNSTMGGVADTWGRSWTDTEFADGTFLVKVEGKSSTVGNSCRLDFLQIKVYFTIFRFYYSRKISQILAYVRNLDISRRIRCYSYSFHIC